jgi:hypothetical protein
VFRWVEIEKFDGGYAHTNGIAIGKESLNMIRYGQNIRTRSGAVEQRDGTLDYCDFSLAPAIMGETIEAIYEYQREGYSGADTDIWSAIVFSLNGSGVIYFVEPDTYPNVAVPINTGDALSSHDFYAVVYFDHMFFGTGRDTIKSWDGITWSNAGIAKPAAAPGVVAAAGALTGYRRYKYTYYKSTDPYPKESEASAVATVDMSAGLRSCHMALVSSTDAQVTHIKIYATETYLDPLVPNTDFYLLSYQTNATITLHDNVLDSSLINGAVYDITDRGVPPKVKYMLLSDNRIFGAGDIDNPSIIYYSEPGKPWYWPTNNWDEISRDDGDVITGLGSIGQTRYIFKQNSIWEWTGDPESVTPIRAVERPDATQNMTRLGIGCRDPRTLCSWGNTLIFRASDKHIYMLTSDSLIQLSRYVETDINGFGWGAEACIHNDYYVVGAGNRVLVCDLRKGMFGWTGYDTNIAPNCFLVDHNGYCLGSEDDKIIRYYNPSTLLDNGVDMVKIFQPAYVKIGRANREGIARAVVVECSDQSCNLNVDLYTEDGIVALDDSVYELTEAVHYLGGKRADFISVRLQWEGAVVVEKVSYGWRYSRRH